MPSSSYSGGSGAATTRRSQTDTSARWEFGESRTQNDEVYDRNYEYVADYEDDRYYISAQTCSYDERPVLEDGEWSCRDLDRELTPDQQAHVDADYFYANWEPVRRGRGGRDCARGMQLGYLDGELICAVVPS
ncbi:MAG: hypothetical protein Q8R02_10990 [Hyphomonadaceae bacterium]|nr:hypothetical protein [Hyphomonadaceae bacterium]